MPVRFGTDGVRGLAMAELTPHDVLEIGRAAARALGGPRLLVGRDPRRSGPALEAALAAGVASEGVDVELLGVLPTPAVAHLAQVEGVPAAMITASHNPFYDNGVKLFAAGGRKLDDATQGHIEHDLRTELPYERMGIEVGEVRIRHDAAGAYVDWVTEQLPTGALGGLRVGLDPAHGAMSEVAPEVLRRLGAEVSVVHAEPDGTNINDACGATAPSALAHHVTARGLDLGLAFDGDGDRVIAVDHTGAVVDGDRLLALEALDRRDEGRLSHDTVVVTVMTNLGFHRAMESAGIEVITTAVGDRSVLEALDRGGFTLGGEQSGHIIHYDLAPTGDGLLAGVLLANLVHRRGVSLADLAGAVMERFPQVLVNVPVRGDSVAVVEAMASAVRDAEAALGRDGRVLVRASGTEPLVRVMVEAHDGETAERLAHHLAEVARSAG